MTDEETVDVGPPRHKRSKVDRVIADHDLEGAGAELERYWTGRDTDRRSLRDLADHFNRKVLRHRMEAAGMNPLDGEVANTFRLLTSDDVTSGARTRAERRLEREGIDVEALREDFVSHQAVHTYLTEYRDVDLDARRDDATDPVASARRTIQRLSSRTQAVGENTVESLDGGESVSIGEFDVSVDVQVACRDCGSQYGLVEFLDRGACDCPD